MSTYLPPPGSRAVLIGVSTYDDPDLPPLPAAFNSVIAMRDLLTDPDRGAWPPDAVTVITDPDNPGRLAARIRTLASTTEGTFLLYFVGHGMLTATGELCLAVADTNAAHPDFTGLPYEWIRNALKPSESPAPTKLVILDCCHSGQATEALAAADDLASRTDIKGAYTLTATASRHQTAHVPVLDQQRTACTTFTAELIALTETGIPGGGPDLTIGALFPHLRSRLISAGFPAPNQRGTDTASHHPFTKNRHGALPTPKEPTATLAEARKLVGERRYQEAEAICRIVIKHDPTNPHAHDDLGDALRGQGDHAAAEAAYREAIRLDPNHFNAHNDLGLNLLEQKHYTEAEAAFRQAIRITPGHPTPHNNLGRALDAQNRHAAAETAFREAIRLNPAHAAAHDNLGDILRRQGDHAAAEAAYREAIRLDPDYFNAHNGLGLNFIEQKRYTEAETAFREAVRLQESAAVLRDNLGDSLYFQERYEEAEATYREAIRLNPTYVRAWKDLGYALRKQGKRAAAKAAFAEAEHLEKSA